MPPRLLYGRFVRVAVNHRVDAVRHSSDFVQDVLNVDGVLLEVDGQALWQRQSKATVVDIASDRHDRRELPELFEDLWHADVTRMND